jgi:hypothetical protein
MRLIKTTLLLLLISASHLVLAAAPTPTNKPDALVLSEPNIVKITQKYNIHVVYDGEGWSGGGTFFPT